MSIPNPDRPEHHRSPAPVQNLPVHDAAAFRVSSGVNQGDPLGIATDLVLEDIYELDKTARPRRLALTATDHGEAFTIAPDSEVGQPGARLFLDSLLTFMAPHGATIEVLVLVETDPEGMIAGTYLHPLSPLAPDTEHALVTIARDGARDRLAQTACVSFARGTHITLADGRQIPVEDLRPGDRVLTRDSGPQELRWIGMQTLRATGAFAPITIAPGALNNTGELTLSPNHRLFIYQRTDRLGAGQPEVMVRAGALVNGVTVVQSEGGFVDYFQLLFDKHEIIYAEGIAAESLFVDPTTGPAVPPDIRARLKESARPVSPGRELEPREAPGPDMVELLKHASAG